MTKAEEKKPRSPAQLAADQRARDRMKGHAPGATHHASPTREREVTTSNAGALKAQVQFVTERHVRKDKIGALLQGFVSGLGSGDAVSVDEYFAPDAADGSPTQHSAEWRANADERAIGREMALALGYALVKYKLSAQDVAGWYQLAIDRVERETGLPVTRSTNASSGTGEGGFLAPLRIPSRVTSNFLEVREGQPHRGTDLAAPIGTPVQAPWDGRVRSFTEDEGGLVVELATRRPDGNLAGESTSGDDSGMILRFAHLSEMRVKENSDVKRGDIIALTGNSGRTTGPHLHVMAELYVDAPFFSMRLNDRVVMDPAGIWGGESNLTGQRPARGVPVGGTIAGLSFPRGASSTGQPITVTVQSGGQVAISSGTTTQVNTSLQAVLPLGRGTGDISMDGPAAQRSLGAPLLSGPVDLLNGMPLPPGLDLVRQVVGGIIGPGLGVLSGAVFDLVKDPRGLLTNLGAIGGPLLSGAGAVAPIAGAIAAGLAVPAGAIPYVGPAVSGVLGAFAGVAANPLTSVLLGVGGGVVTAGSRMIGGVSPDGVAFPDFDKLLGKLPGGSPFTPAIPAGSPVAVVI